MQRRNFLQVGLAGAGAVGLATLAQLPAAAEDSNPKRPTPQKPFRAPIPAGSKRTATRPVYCCIFTEFIQPWDQNAAIRQIKELGLGNMVSPSETFHVGNSPKDRQFWKQQFLTLAEKIDAVPQFPGRPEHGHCAIFDLPVEFRREQVKLCQELGLMLFGWPRELPGEERQQYRDMMAFTALITAENASILGVRLSLDKLKAIDAKPVTSHSESYFAEEKKRTGASIFENPEQLDFQVMHDWFVARFHTHGAALRDKFGGPLAAIEASAQIRLSLAAGGDVPIFELVPSEPLRGLAATRGAAVAYGKNLWGLHTAMGYYRAPSDAWTPERLRIAYDLFYAGGARYFSEPNIALCNWGSCSAFFTVADSPAMRWTEKECLPFDDPICIRGREVLSSFYRFTQFHQRPADSPRVRLGYLLGNLDAWTGDQEDRMWMVDQPGFLAADALKTWRHFGRAFASESWYDAPRKYYWQADPAKALRHGTPPCGQVDLVPAEAPLDALQRYGTLVLLGWNTMTEALYEKFVAFVTGGGTLFLAVPHLDTRTRTDRPQAFVHDGDVQKLCGVRIVGPGAAQRDVFVMHQAENPRHVMPQGTCYLESAPLAEVELRGARVLAHPRGKPEQPVLVEHRVGKGTVYLLTTWEYPGERLDAFITDILRTLAEAEQAEIAVAGRDVFYSIYDGKLPSGQSFAAVYLINHDIYSQPAYPTLSVGKPRLPIRVANELRIAWVIDTLVISPFDRFAQVTDARREPNGWTVILESAPDISPAERRVQIHSSEPIRSITLDGGPLKLEKGIEGDQFVMCELTGSHKLRIEMNK